MKNQISKKKMKLIEKNKNNVKNLIISSSKITVKIVSPKSGGPVRMFRKKDKGINT